MSLEFERSGGVVDTTDGSSAGVVCLTPGAADENSPTHSERELFVRFEINQTLFLDRLLVVQGVHGSCGCVTQPENHFFFNSAFYKKNSNISRATKHAVTTRLVHKQRLAKRRRFPFY